MFGNPRKLLPRILLAFLLPACSAKTSSAQLGLMFRPPPTDPGVMISWLLLAFRALTGMARSRASSAAENASRCQNAMQLVSPRRG
jgi:hypothetical protein